MMRTPHPGLLHNSVRLALFSSGKNSLVIDDACIDVVVREGMCIVMRQVIASNDLRAQLVRRLNNRQRIACTTKEEKSLTHRFSFPAFNTVSQMRSTSSNARSAYMGSVITSVAAFLATGVRSLEYTLL